MDWTPKSAIRGWFSFEQGASNRLIPRWLLLRALGLIYFSAFYSLIFQIRGLIGPHGILPAGEYLQAVARSAMVQGRFWYVPSLLWISSSSRMLMVLCWAGMVASLLLVLNFWPRAMLVVCFACFVSFVSAAQDFTFGRLAVALAYSIGSAGVLYLLMVGGRRLPPAPDARRREAGSN